MPKLSQPPMISPHSTATQPPSTPFTLDTVRRTVLKLANPFGCQQSSVPAVSRAVLLAMQRLVDMITTLRSSQPSFLEGLSPRSTGAIAALLPYISEEAYDVLDALRRAGDREQGTGDGGQGAENRDQEVGISDRALGNGEQGLVVHALSKFEAQALPIETSSAPLCFASSHALIAIETLIPALLWQIARSDYSVMRLIEGVGGQCWQPEQDWAAGMLRLVVMLELEAPTVRWCFDLATGQPAEGLLAPIAHIQTEEPVLPVAQTAQAGNDLNDASCQVEYQLQAILQLLQAETLGLEDFLQGSAVELLQPGAGWQTGELRLRFGFEFSPHGDAANDETAQTNPELNPELIDAELIENGATIACSIVTTPMLVAGLGRSLSSATLLRASDAAVLEHYTQQTNDQQIAQSLSQLQRQLSHENENTSLAIIVQAALLALDRKAGVAGIGLQQPTLLSDELAPKLLWSLTSCSYEMMQLLGGLPAQVLEPGAVWQQGTLRLLAVLRITGADLDNTFDLSTGRSVSIETAQLVDGAIVQASAIARCQQPTPIATLTAHLQQLWEHTPESKLLVDGLAIEWLEDVEQDWQAGKMTLHLRLGFLADGLQFFAGEL